MQKHLFPMIVLLGLTASAVYLMVAKPVVAAQTEQSTAVFDSDGKVRVANRFSHVGFCGCPLDAQRPQQWESELPRVSPCIH